jgi:cell fate (sporulation/competence/biofilm development) regulator YlbF (YheA/YmcA/DUF963 family)
VIPQKAEDLGRQIGQTDEYQALKRAQDRLQGAKELAVQLRRLQDLAEGLERTMERGETPSEADRTAYEQVLSQVQADPVYQGMVAAQANFDKLMVRVNEHILDGIRKGAASPIITLS